MCLKADRKAALAKKFELPETATDDEVIDQMEKAFDGGEPAFADVSGRLDAAAAEVAALSAALADRDAEVLRLTGAVAEKEARVLELSGAAPKAPDAVTLGMYAENVAAKREAAVAAGAVSEAQAKGLDALLAGADGTPTALALSAAGPARKPLAFAVWDWVKGLSAGDAVRTNNAVPRGVGTAAPPQFPALDLSGAGGDPAKNPDADAEAVRKASDDAINARYKGTAAALNVSTKPVDRQTTAAAK